MNKGKGLKIDNIQFTGHVHFQKLKCEFNQQYTELIGINGSGKTTVINALWLAVKGIALKGKDCIIGDRFRFIANGRRSMDVEIALIDERANNARILIKRHITKSGSTITFKAPDDYPISQEWLDNLLSVSFLSAKNFTQKNKKEQALLLGINTAAFDERLETAKETYKSINRELKALGNPEPVEKVEPVDVEKLLETKRLIQDDSQREYKRNQQHNSELRQQYEKATRKAQEEAQRFNGEQQTLADKHEEINQAHVVLLKNGYKGREVAQWINGLPKPQPHKDWHKLKIKEPDYINEIPDQSRLMEIDNQIANAHDINSKAREYNNYCVLLSKINSFKKSLEDNKKQQQQIIQEKIDYLQAKNLKFKGLEIDEQGGLILHGREIREPYFSKGELEKIVAGLRAEINDDLKVIFIDDFDLLDDDNQKSLPEYLIKKGFQVIVAKVGRAKNSENIIALSEIIESEQNKPELV